MKSARIILLVAAWIVALSFDTIAQVQIKHLQELLPGWSENTDGTIEVFGKTATYEIDQSQKMIKLKLTDAIKVSELTEFKGISLLPSEISAISLNGVTIDVYPFDKRLKLTTKKCQWENTDFGKLELAYKKENKKSYLLTGFKISDDIELANVLGDAFDPIDKLNLTGRKLVYSNHKQSFNKQLDMIPDVLQNQEIEKLNFIVDWEIPGNLFNRSFVFRAKDFSKKPLKLEASPKESVTLDFVSVVEASVDDLLIEYVPSTNITMIRKGTLKINKLNLEINSIELDPSNPNISVSADLSLKDLHESLPDIGLSGAEVNISRSNFEVSGDYGLCAPKVNFDATNPVLEMNCDFKEIASDIFDGFGKIGLGAGNLIGDGKDFIVDLVDMPLDAVKAVFNKITGGGGRGDEGWKGNYTAFVKTADKDAAGTDDGPIKMKVIGSLGTKEWFNLNKDGYDDKERGNTDEVKFSSEDLGFIHRIELTSNEDDGWLMDYIVIEDPDENKYLFKNKKNVWMGSYSSNKTHITLNRNAFELGNIGIHSPEELNRIYKTRGIWAFADENFNGGMRTIPASWNMNDDLGFNDKISSIKIPEGFMVQIFEHADFSGKNTLLFNNKSELSSIHWNDKISSMIVYEAQALAPDKLNSILISAGFSNEAAQIAMKELQPKIEPNRYYYIEAKHSGKVLDVSNKSQANGAAFHQWYKAGVDNQKFKLVPTGNEYYYIEAKHSGKVLDVSKKSQANGAAFHQWSKANVDNQKFKLELTADGYYCIVAKHSGKVLDVSNKSQANGAAFHQWSKANVDNQKFKLILAELSTPEPGKYYYIEAKHSGKVLDVSNKSKENEAVFHQWKKTGGDNQKFKLEPAGGEYYYLVAKHSGKVLTIKYWKNNLFTSYAYMQMSKTREDNQKFKLVSLGGGYYYLLSKSTGKVLGVRGESSDNGALLYQWDKAGDDNQKFKLVPVELSTPEPGKYYYIEAKHSGKVLDVSKKSQANGAAFHQWSKANVDNQKFTLESTADGYYYIVAKHSGKVLDVSNKSQANGAAFHQWSKANVDNQKFTLESTADGYYYIVAKHSGKVLDVSNKSQTNGAVFHQWSKNGGDSQKFKLIPVDMPLLK